MSKTIIPCLRYHDAKQMIGWLNEAFGFVVRVVHEGNAEEVAHAQLTLGEAMIMVSSVPRDADADDFGRLQSTPRKLSGTSQSPYIVVTDIDATYAKAKSAGARIAMELAEEPYGRVFSCTDPEGHLWNFGDYDPWAS